LLTLSEVTGISGEEGDFTVDVTQHPRYVDLDKCIACGLCAEKCPKKVPDEYNSGLINRKAIYVKYPQAVPLKYAIDAEHCLKLTKGKCGNCEKVCPAGAINYQDTEKQHHLKVGAIVIAQGGEAFDPSTHDTFGYGRYPDIVTSLEFERLLSASGPTGGHLVRPSDHKEPEKIAWLQCVGSRDEHIGARGYCSAVCCTYAVKEAMLAKEHSKGKIDTAVFYIDIRTNGKDFERYYNRAKDEIGVRFIKSRVIGIPYDAGSSRYLLNYVDDKGRKTREPFDMVVLSVGLGVSSVAKELAGKLGVELNHYGYAATSSFSPVCSSVPGIYVCGTFQAPKDIPSSVIDSSAAAGVAGSSLAESRWTLTRTKDVVQEVDVRGESPRIGVFVCCCGTNIAGTVDVERVKAFAERLPYVTHAEVNLFSCSQDTQEKMAQVIREQNLNRVVVAACTPKTHEPLFQETLTGAGINKYLFEMANIRNQCSWVHKDEPEKATEKALDLVRMAVSKVALLQPLTEPILEIDQRALVIGGGVAGMSAAINLSDQGYKSYLLERTGKLGGNSLKVAETWRREDVQAFLREMISRVESDPSIDVHLNAEITGVEGFVGNFKTTVSEKEESVELEHGVTIIASGASELVSNEHLYGESPRVLTGLEFQQRMMENKDSLRAIHSAAFLQCVGSRIPERPYCSKLCCTQSLLSAIKIKEVNPGATVYIVYRDMRPYGLREDLYREARGKGVIFIRYDEHKDLNITDLGSSLGMTFTDTVFNRAMSLRPDLLVLASAVVPDKDDSLASFYKVTRNDDGFFAEAHVKLRPVDFATDGVFVCGLAHSPKPIDESITQAQAAAARAVTLLSSRTIPVAGTVAYVDQNLCSACGVCVSICPYSAPSFNEKTGKAQVEPALCKGCGLCVSSCRSGALNLRGFEMGQIMSMIDSV
jgi:heterodisulfide reductase subunit A2